MENTKNTKHRTYLDFCCKCKHMTEVGGIGIFCVLCDKDEYMIIKNRRNGEIEYNYITDSIPPNTGEIIKNGKET